MAKKIAGVQPGFTGDGNARSETLLTSVAASRLRLMAVE
jgi:hypothetical protein